MLTLLAKALMAKPPKPYSAVARQMNVSLEDVLKFADFYDKQLEKRWREAAASSSCVCEASAVACDVVWVERPSAVERQSEYANGVELTMGA
jgi:hypothetical protein